jgi:hypothetical protein
MKTLRLSAILACIAAALASGSAAAEATTHVVTPGRSIQAAVDRASPGDTVIVTAGVYREQVLVATDELTLIGWGAQIRPPTTTGLSPCADPNNPNETVGVCVFGFSSAGSAGHVRVVGFTVSGFDSGLVAVGAGESLFAWNRALDNELFGFVGVLSPGLRLLANDARGSHVAGIAFFEQRDGGAIAANLLTENGVGVLVEHSDRVAIIGNRYRGNGVDIVWDGDGVSNVFAGNSCRTIEPTGLC